MVSLLKHCTFEGFFFMHLNDNTARKNSRFKYIIQYSKNSVPLSSIAIAQLDNNKILVRLRQSAFSLWDFSLLEFFSYISS